MLHNEARELLVQGYEATHDAKGIAKAYSVSKWTVYRLAEQKRKTGSVALRTSQRGRKPVLTAEDKEKPGTVRMGVQASQQKRYGKN